MEATADRAATGPGVGHKERTMRKILGAVAISLAVAAGVLAGYGYGIYRAQQGFGRVARQMVCDAASARLGPHVKALEHLRTGEREKAVELIERLIDVDLAALAPYAEDISKHDAGGAMIDVRTVKHYRARYPQHEVPEPFKKSVDGLLELAK